MAFVTNEREGSVTVIDTVNDEAVRTLTIGARPRGIRASADRKTVYVALSPSQN
jgi:YVTN family beta-propeller protein